MHQMPEFGAMEIDDEDVIAHKSVKALKREDMSPESRDVESIRESGKRSRMCSLCFSLLAGGC